MAFFRPSKQRTSDLALGWKVLYDLAGDFVWQAAFAHRLTAMPRSALISRDEAQNKGVTFVNLGVVWLRSLGW